MASDPPLSEREREILRLVASGASNVNIANQLVISPNTVKVHIRNIFGKIGVTSRTEAVLFAIRSGLIDVREASTSTTSSHDSVIESPTPEPLVALQPDSAENGRVQPIVLTDLSPNGKGDGVASRDTLMRQPSAKSPNLPFRLTRREIYLLGFAFLVLFSVLGATWATRGVTPMPTPTTASVSAAQATASGNRWRELAPMPEGVTGFALAGLSQEGRGMLYVIGGQKKEAISANVLRYDVGNNIWVPLSQKPTPVTDVHAVVIAGRVYVPGGKLATGQITGVLEVYDPAQDRWTTLAPLPEPRAGYSLGTVEGKLYLLGGWDGASFRSEVWQYNPDDNTWRERTPLPTARANGATSVFEREIYVIGGENATGALNVNERYNPTAEGRMATAWAIRAPSPAPLARADSSTVGGLILTLGTEGSASRLWIYNPINDSWSISQTPLGTLGETRVEAIGDRLYILGGRDAAGPSAQAFGYQAISSVFLPSVQ